MKKLALLLGALSLVSSVAYAKEFFKIDIIYIRCYTKMSFIFCKTR